MKFFPSLAIMGFSFEALPGYFRAFPEVGAPPVDSSVVDHLELVSHESWKDLYSSIPADTDDCSYKLLLLARHGQGYHNAAILRYGMRAWNEHWALLDGDEYGEWLDSKLTPMGQKQVESTGKQVLVPIVKELGMQPSMFFSSPMKRCLETFLGSWDHVFANDKSTVCNKVNVQVIEKLRETLGVHTCDKRVNHSITVNEYQSHKTPSSGVIVHWEYEPGYVESDALWQKTHRETPQEMDLRINEGLVQMFESTKPSDKFISLTCHSGVIQSVLKNLKHPAIENLDTGKVVCVVVKVQRTN